jgi:hypothetical protein
LTDDLAVQKWSSAGGTSRIARSEIFAELCKNFVDGSGNPTMLLVPRHCGIGVPDVFFPSRLTRESIRSGNLNRAGVVRESGSGQEQLIFDSAILDFVYHDGFFQS